MGTAIASFSNYMQNRTDVVTMARERSGIKQNDRSLRSATMPGPDSGAACAPSGHSGHPGESHPGHTGEVYLASTADAHLLSLIASGERDALEALYDRYCKACYGTAVKVVADPYIAEEIVQDVFLRVWTAPFSYVPERGTFTVWLLTLVRNRSIDCLRKEKHQRITSSLESEIEKGSVTSVTLADILPDEANSPYEQAWRREQSRALRRAMSLLPVTEREAIGLGYMSGLTQREIAEKLHVPVGTIKSRIVRGLRRLGGLLDGEDLLGDVA